MIFFIVSQSVKNGNVTPTHYNVIYDMVCLKPVPAPCHYARKLAYLVGQSIHQQPNQALSNNCILITFDLQKVKVL
ncbi:piwi-like protein 3 [Dugong dugon]